MLVSAFGPRELATDYVAFGGKWRGVDTQLMTPIEALVSRVELHLDWLTSVREDLQLPPSLLAHDWPATGRGIQFQEANQRLSELELPVLVPFS